MTDLLAGSDQLGLLEGGGGWNAAASGGSAAGTALAAADYLELANMSAITSAANNKMVEVQSGQTAAQISAPVAGGVANAYVLVFNTTTGRGELWHDTNWSDAGNRVQVATFDDIDQVSELTGLSASNFAEWL